ncbi:MAG: hypothetical protein ACYDHO_08055, partial [Gaiellaceae bacterium]
GSTSPKSLFRWGSALEGVEPWMPGATRVVKAHGSSRLRRARIPVRARNKCSRIGAVRRLGALTLTLALAAVVAFAADYGFVHRPDSGGRTEQALYAGALLIPPALFLLLALVLLLRSATGTNVLALIAIAALVGAPTLVFFLGGLVGLSLTAAALLVIGALSAVLIRRPDVEWPGSQIGSG